MRLLHNIAIPALHISLPLLGACRDVVIFLFARAYDATTYKSHSRWVAKSIAGQSRVDNKYDIPKSIVYNYRRTYPSTAWDTFGIRAR